MRSRLTRAVGQTGGLITSAAAITACSFASFLFSPLASLRQLGFALVVGITIDAVLVRPVLVPCGHWLMNRRRSIQPRMNTD
jgi:RND superfamily putative drug exporter